MSEKHLQARLIDLVKRLGILADQIVSDQQAYIITEGFLFVADPGLERNLSRLIDTLEMFRTLGGEEQDVKKSARKLLFDMDCGRELLLQ